MAKKRRSRPKGKNRSRKQSNTGHIVRNTITVIVIIAIIIPCYYICATTHPPCPSEQITHRLIQVQQYKGT